MLSVVIRLGEAWPGLSCLWVPLEGREVEALCLSAALHQRIGGPHIKDRRLTERVQHLWVGEAEAASLQGEFWSVLRTLPPGEARLLDLAPPPDAPRMEGTLTIWTASSVKFRVQEPAPREERSTVRLEEEALLLLALLWSAEHPREALRELSQRFPDALLDLLEGRSPLVSLAPHWLAYLRRELRAPDLSPLFSHYDSEVRERALRSLPFLFPAS